MAIFNFGKPKDEALENKIQRLNQEIAIQKAKLTDIAEEQALVSSEQTPEERIEDQAALNALRLSKERYQGVAKCGIEALELKLKGYSGAEIAKMYQVKPNYIAACICRAVKYLKKDKAFFTDLGK